MLLEADSSYWRSWSHYGWSVNLLEKDKYQRYNEDTNEQKSGLSQMILNNLWVNNNKHRPPVQQSGKKNP